MTRALPEQMTTNKSASIVTYTIVQLGAGVSGSFDVSDATLTFALSAATVTVLTPMSESLYNDDIHVRVTLQ